MFTDGNSNVPFWVGSGDIVSNIQQLFIIL